MNLLTACWLPVRLRDGQRVWIGLEQLVRHDIVAFDASRPDFNGALMQWALAMLQWLQAPDSESGWRRRFLQGPDRDEWGAALAAQVDAFELGGPGPRFLQDIDLPRETAGTTVDIAGLLIEEPGDSTLDHNADHFIKRGRIRHLCSGCAATALLTLQLNAPAGGRGHRTGLRGGGPLTTLVTATGADGLPLSLWHTLWLNVLPVDVFESLNGDAGLTTPALARPWLGSIRSLQSTDDSEIAPVQTHPLHVLFSMPRRIWLDLETTASGTCGICQRPGEQLIQRYRTRVWGLNYKGPWRHPCTPYYQAKDTMLPVHPQPGGIGYRHWLPLVMGVASKDRCSEAAAVVQQFLAQRQNARRIGMNLQLWAFGHDLDNAKVRCWYDATLPLYDLADCDPAARRELDDEVSAWLAGADLARYYLTTAVRTAWFSDKAKGDLSHVDAAFWSRTEPAFYQHLKALIDRLRHPPAPTDPPTHDDTRERWLKQLRAAVLALFDQDFVGAGLVERGNPKRVALAHAALQRSLNGGKLRQALRLSVPDEGPGARAGSRPPKATASRPRKT